MTNENLDAISMPIDHVPIPPAPPAVNEESRAVLDEAITALTDLRFPLSRYDAAAELHAVASLQGQIEARITDIVASARDQELSWDDIATCLGVSVANCRRRYDFPDDTERRRAT